MTLSGKDPAKMPEVATFPEVVTIMVPGGGSQWSSLLDSVTAEITQTLPTARHARTIHSQREVCDLVVMAHEMNRIEPFVECVFRRQGDHAVLEVRRFVRKRVGDRPAAGYALLLLAAMILVPVWAGAFKGSDVGLSAAFIAIGVCVCAGGIMVQSKAVGSVSTGADSESRALFEGVKHAVGSVAGRFHAAYGFRP